MANRDLGRPDPSHPPSRCPPPSSPNSSIACAAARSRAALTQADGRYLITGVPAGADSLRTRMIGYVRAARPVTVVGGETLVVDVALTAQAINLSEVVVTGYGEQRAGDITGAVT